MKKLTAFIFTLILLFPILLEGKAFFRENYLRTEYSESYNNSFVIYTPLIFYDVIHYDTVRHSSEFIQTNFILDKDIEINDQKIEKPPERRSRIAGELAAGYGVGTLFGVIGGLFGSRIVPPDESWFPGRELAGSVIGFLIAFPIGSSIGVYLVGNIGDETGSFWATLAGSFLGALVFVFPAPVGASIGFNMTRRYKTTPSSEIGLINFDNSEISLNIPSINIKSDPLNETKLYQSIDLVKIRF